MTHEGGTVRYERYLDFLEADPRRSGNALELGHRWREAGARYRVCWYESTGEITAERISEGSIDLDDFHRGVLGPVEILGRLPTRQALEDALGPWPSPLDSISPLAEIRRLAPCQLAVASDSPERSLIPA